MPSSHYGMRITSEEIHAARIMVLDDRPDNTEILLHHLNEGGFNNVLPVNDPRLGVQMLLEETCDLLLLDIKMPHMDGFQVMQQVTRNKLPVAVIVLTAVPDRSIRLKSLQAGAGDFLNKPFDAEEVLARVCNLLEAHLAQKRLAEQKGFLETQVHLRTADLESSNRELHATRLEIIQRLGRAGEYKDNETGLHVIRVSHYALLLAQASGLEKNAVQLVFHAAPMHDIGKIGIPDHILLKPGSLDAEERKIMQNHADIGAEIIGHHTSDLLKMARTVALTHHEKWDGSGYPNHVQGSAIPLSGRIVAIADVFDALTSRRPYKSAWPIEKALSLLHEQSGQHFDPKLVTQFVAVLPKVIQIMETFQDS